MGLLAPWFLGGLAALGVPVFVHLLRRHVTTPRPVGSLMFFERGTQSSTRHKRLRYLLLFALRFALLLLLVLAFANPFVKRPAADPSGRLLVVVLDHSFSMRAGGHFAEAKREALAMVAGKSPRQRVQVVELGGQMRPLTQTTTDAAQLRSALEGVEPGDERASFGDMGQSLRSLAEAEHGPMDVHLFSDLQKTAMPGNFADLVLPANATLALHSVSPIGVQPNWTVMSVDAPAELADPKDLKRSHVKAVIAGFGTPAVTRTVSLVVNGKMVATRHVEVPAAGRATVEFAPIDVGYGVNRCALRVEGGDAFSQDDASLFTVRRSDPQRVLFVHGADDARSPLYFGAALGAAAQSSLTLQPVTTAQTADLDPAKYAFVVLSDVVGLPVAFERGLTQYVQKGGSVLLAAGTRAGRGASLPLWGGKVQEVRDYLRTGGAATVGQVDFTYPALAQASPGRSSGGWGDSRIFYAASVEVGTARVAARLSDGTPLVMDKAVGLGHVLLFASGFDKLTNDLPLHPVFVAFVDQAARYLSGVGRLSGARVVDDVVSLRSAGEPVGEMSGVEVIDPAGKRPLSLSEARTATSFRLEQTGFYQVHLASGRDAVIGVNADRRESDLEPVAAEVQRLWSGSAGTETRVAIGPTVAPASRVVPLWWWVILLALLTAVAETVVASGYLGTQREQA